MKLSNFVQFGSHEYIDVGDVIVLSHNIRNENHIYLVCGVPVKDDEEYMDNKDYSRYQLVNLNIGRVVYETEEADINELWEYFEDYQTGREYNELLVGNNNIIISFEADKKS